MKNTVRNTLTLAGLIFGLLVGNYGLSAVHPVSGPYKAIQGIGLVLIIGALGGFLMYVFSERLTHSFKRFTGWVEAKSSRLNAPEAIWGGFGLILGLIAGYLLSLPLAQLPLVGHFLPILVSLFLGYVGLTMGRKMKDELAGLTGLRASKSQGGGKGQSGSGTPAGSTAKVLDTSVIIDGRIADILKTHFLEGPIVVPAFVLEELRHIADSSDVLKRNRGRRGLDILNKIQKDLDIPVQIMERDFGGDMEVDSKLLRLAQMLGGYVVTNDYNLNKVAVLQGVAVLNINDLANAVKPVVLPGEEMLVHIIKDGKEMGQGVGYLDDGTMIVVDGGKRYIGDTLEVLVTSVLQTSAGRMIFAKPKAHEGLGGQAISQS